MHQHGYNPALCAHSATSAAKNEETSMIQAVALNCSASMTPDPLRPFNPIEVR